MTQLLRSTETGAIAPSGQRSEHPESGQDKFLPKRAVANRYGVTTRTIDRWRFDEKLGFPAPVFSVNDRGFWAEEELLQWEADCIRARTSRASAA